MGYVDGPQVSTFPVTIANGGSLSPAIDLALGRLTRIIMPAAWDTANLTFQTSMDGVTWNNFYDSYGTEYTVTAAAARSILIPLADFIGVQFIKIRSGTNASPVNQTADRALTLVVVPV